MNSTQYKNKIDKYSVLKKSLSVLQDTIGTCKENITSCSNYVGDLIINNKSIDKDVLITSANGLGDCCSKIQQAIIECDGKIDHYIQLYNAALAKESMDNGVAVTSSDGSGMGNA